MRNHHQVELLLVEDTSTDAEMTMHALAKNNFRHKVFWVKDGQEALDFLYCEGEYADRNTNENPRLILLDMRMPKVDGLGVLRRIKADKRLRAIPVVVMTSMQDEHILIDSYHLGVNGYVIKPVDFKQFYDVVKGIGIYWLEMNHPPIFQPLAAA